MRESLDVVNRVLRLTPNADELVFHHLPCVLGVHGDGTALVHHLNVDAVRLNVGEFDVKRRRSRCAVVVGAHRRERLGALDV